MKRFLSILLAVLLFGVANAQLSGVYSINRTGSGTRNFVSLDTAFKALKVQGMSAAVTFQLANGVHDIDTINDFLVIENIPTTRTNNLTLTSQSGNPNLCRIKGKLHFINSPYITVKDINFKYKNLRIELLTFIASNGITISGCRFGTDIDYQASYAIATNGGDSININNCVFLDARKGIYSQATANYPGAYTRTKFVNVSNNKFKQSTSSIWLNKIPKVKVTANRVSSSQFNYSPQINIQYCDSVLVNRNIASGISTNILSISFAKPHTTEIKNNVFENKANQNRNGNINGSSVVYLANSPKLKLHHNNFINRGNSNYSETLEFYYSDSIDLKNNIIYADSAFLIKTQYSKLYNQNNNAYYSKKTLNLWGVPNATHANQLPTVLKIDSASVFKDPKFMTGSNFIFTNDSLLGVAKALNSVTTDVFLNNRSSTSPVIGAYEKPIKANDVSLSFNGSWCNNNKVKVTIHNQGLDTLKYLKINGSIDSLGIVKTLPSFLNTKHILPNSSFDTSISLGGSVTGNTSYSLLLHIDSVNVSDPIKFNDTILNTNFTLPLSDTIKVGKNHLYTGIAQAMQAYNNIGHCGSVTFLFTDSVYDIAEGGNVCYVYSKHKDDSIFFVGKNRPLFVNSTITVSDTGLYVSFRNIRFEQNPNSYYKNLDVDNAKWVEVINCEFTQKTPNYYRALIYISGGLKIEVDSSTFKGVSRLIEIENRGKRVDSVIIKNSHFNGLSRQCVFSNARNVYINLANNKFVSSGTSGIVNIDYCSSFNFNANEFIDSQPNGKNGDVVAVRKIASTTKAKGVATNNIFKAIKLNQTNRSLFRLDQFDTIKIINNTFITGKASSNGVALNTGSSNYEIVKNNLFFNEGKVTSLQIRTIQPNTLNNNIYYSNNTVKFRLANVGYSTFSAYKAACKCDSNSKYINPKLSGYFIANPNAVNTGKLHNLAPKDFYGKLRVGGKTNAGAVESDTLHLELALKQFYHKQKCPGTDSVFAILENLGTDTISKVHLLLNVDSAGQQLVSAPLAYLNKIAPNKIDTIFVRNFNFYSGTKYPFTLHVDSVNGIQDSLQINDTISSRLSSKLGGSIIVSPIASNSSYKKLENLITNINKSDFCDTLVVNIPDSLVWKGNLLTTIKKDTNRVLVFNGTAPNSVIYFENGSNINVEYNIVFKNIKLNCSKLVAINYVDLRNHIYFQNCNVIGSFLAFRPQNREKSVLSFENTTMQGPNGTACLSIINRTGISKLKIDNCKIKGYLTFVDAKRVDSLIINQSQFYLDTVNSYSGKFSISDITYSKVTSNRISSLNMVTFRGRTSATKSWLISNNVIHQLAVSRYSYALNISSAFNSVIANNTIVQNISKRYNVYGITGLNVYNCDTAVVKNNLIQVNDTTATIYHLVNSGLSDSIKFSNNSYYNAKRTNFQFNNTTYTTYTAWKNVSGDTNSLIQQVKFNTDTFLLSHSHHLDSAGVTISGVTKDLLGKLRNTSKPDIGAYEIDLYKNDAEVLSWSTTANCNDSIQLAVQVFNAGTDTLKSVSVYLKYGNANDTLLHTFTGLKLNPQSDTLFNLKAFRFFNDSLYKITLASYLPNGVSDQRLTNDTLIFSKRLYIPFQGDYLVGNAKYFSSLNDYSKKVVKNGICGNVRLFLTDSIYSYDTLKLDAIKGMNDGFSTFLGKDSSLAKLPKLEYSWVFLQDVERVTIDSLFFESKHKVLGNGYGRGQIEISDRVKKVTIKNCQFDSLSRAFTAAVHNYETSVNNDSIFILYNTFSNVRYAVVSNHGYIPNYKPINHFKFNNNRVNSTIEGFYFSDLERLEMLDNEITAYNMPSSKYVVRIAETKDLSFKRNKVIATSTAYFSRPVVHLETNRKGICVFDNNYIYAKNNLGVVFDADRTDTILLRNNTFVQALQTKTSLSTVVDLPSLSKVEFRNNIVYSEVAKTKLINTRLYSHIPRKWDNNVYHSLDSTTAFTLNWSTLSWASWKTNAKVDSNSKFTNPYFVATEKPESNSQYVNNKAKPIVGLTSDINGSLRSTTTPDIGCVEFSPIDHIINLKGLSMNESCAGTANIKVNVFNNGIDTVNTCRIKVWKPGVTLKSVKYSQLQLLPKTDTVLVLDTVNLANKRSYLVSAVIDSVESGAPLASSIDTITQKVHTSYNGTYTIGTDSINNDFTSFQSAFDELKSAGMCGPVSLVLVDSSSNNLIDVPYIRGNSSVNLLTIKGKKQANGKLPVSTHTWSIRFRGIQYVKVDSLTFKSSSFYLHDSAKKIVVTNCNFDTSYAHWFNTGTYRLDTLILTANRVRGHNRGIRLDRLSKKMSFLKLDSNFIYGVRSDGLVVKDVTNAQLISNTIMDTNSVSAYSNFTYVLFSDFDSIRVENNRFNYLYKETQFGSFVQNSSRPAWAKSVFVNNEIISKRTQAFSLVGLKNFKFYHNSLKTGDKGGNSAIHIRNSDSSEVINNIVISDRSCFYQNNSAINKSIKVNYNIYHGTNVFFGTPLSTRRSLGYDSNSVIVNVPFFGKHTLNTNDVTIGSAGKTLPFPKKDILGKQRKVTPTPGAYEVDSVKLDMAAVDAYIKSSCLGSDSVYAVFKNLGKDTIKTARFAYEISCNDTNYVWRDSLTIRVNLTSGKIDTLSLGYHNFNRYGEYTIVSKVISINGGLDSLVQNNSYSSKGFKVALKGKVLVDARGGYFKSLDQVVKRLDTVGVCGPLTIVIDTSWSLTDVTFKRFKGVSATNTITVTSLDTNNISTLYYGRNGGTIEFDSAAHVTLKHLKFFKLSGWQGIAIKFKDRNDSITLYKLQIGDQSKVHFSQGIYALTSQLFNKIEIIGCKFYNNGNAIYIAKTGFAVNALTISDCLFAGNTSRSVYVYGGNNVKINSNVVSGGSSSWGIYIERSNSVTIDKNKLHTSIALYLESVHRNSFVQNNFITGAVELDNVTGLHYVYNSHNLNTRPYRNWARLGNDVKVKNNIFQYGLTGNPATSYSTLRNKLSHNVYHNTRDTTWKIANWIALTKTDSNSKQLDPQFLSAYDLHVLNSKLDSLGDSVVVRDDIDGDLRPTTYFTPGADMPKKPKIDLAYMGLVSREVCQDSVELELDFRNVGTDTILNYRFIWQLDTGFGGLITDTMLVNDTVPFGESSLVKIKSFYFKSGWRPKFNARVYRVNGNADTIAYNNYKNQDLLLKGPPTTIVYSFQGGNIKICQGLIERLRFTPFGGKFISSSVYNGRTGSSLITDSLKPGKHTIKYRYDYTHYCSVTVESDSFEILEKPTIVQTVPSKKYCSNHGLDTLKYFTPTSGRYYRTGMINDSVFDPKLVNRNTYSIAYEVGHAKNACLAYASISDTIFKAPVLVKTADSGFCDNKADTLQLFIPKGGKYAGKGVGLNNVMRPWAANIGKNKVYYTYKDSNNCAVSDSGHVHVYKKPSIPIIIGDSSQCAFKYSPLSNIAVTTYTTNWSVNGFHIDTGRTVLPLGTGWYKAQTVNGSCFSAADSFFVKVKRRPLQHIPRNVEQFCEIDTGKYFQNMMYPNRLAHEETYWYNSNNLNQPIDSGHFFNIPKTAGNIKYKVRTGSPGCFTPFDSVTAMVDSMPKVDLGPDFELCDSTAVLVNKYPLSNYFWKGGSGAPTLTIDKAGEYYLRSRNGLCYTIDSITVKKCTVGVEEYSILSSNISLLPNPVLEGEQLQIRFNTNAFSSVNSIVLLDLKGNKVADFGTSVRLDQEKVITLPMQGIAHGEYLISIEFIDGSKVVKRLVVVR